MKDASLLKYFLRVLTKHHLEIEMKKGGKEKFDKNERAAEMTVLFIEEVADI